jgi:hypothetical protein
MANVPSTSYTTYNAIMDGITPVTDIGKTITDSISASSADVTSDIATIQALVPLVANPFLAVGAG